MRELARKGTQEVQGRTGDWLPVASAKADSTEVPVAAACGLVKLTKLAENGFGDSLSGDIPLAQDRATSSTPRGPQHALVHCNGQHAAHMGPPAVCR